MTANCQYNVIFHLCTFVLSIAIYHTSYNPNILVLGVGLPLRKMASLAKPEMTISIENDNKIKIVMKTGFFTQEDCFHLNEEFLKEMQGTLMKVANPEYHGIWVLFSFSGPLIQLISI